MDHSEGHESPGSFSAVNLVSEVHSISVIVPTFDSGPYIQQAVDSVLAQTLPVHEILVIDDGSNDDTLERLRPYQQSGKISLIEQPNSGPHTARNRGIRESTGELIAFLDSDDIWYP